MHKETKAVLLVLLLAATPNLLAAETPPQSPSPAALARQVIELTGGADRITRGLQDMAAMIKQRESAPAEFVDEFFASVDKNHIIDLMIPIYIRNLTVEEMKAAIEFYS